MIRTTRHGDVVEFEMSTRQSRRAGLTVSAFLVRGVLVDTGFPRIADEFRQVVDPRQLRGAIVTHYHEDHAGNVGLLGNLGVPVILAQATLARIVAPAAVGLYRRFTWGTADPASRLSPARVPDDLQFLPTPGHSADHHVVWDPAEGSLFGGDLFIGVKVRVAHPGEDIRGTVASLKRVIALEPARLFDAHRGLVPSPLGVLRAKVQWMEDTIGEIERRHHRGEGEGAILKGVLGGEELIGWLSAGDYARRNFVRSVVSTVE